MADRQSEEERLRQERLRKLGDALQRVTDYPIEGDLPPDLADLLKQINR